MLGKGNVIYQFVNETANQQQYETTDTMEQIIITVTILRQPDSNPTLDTMQQMMITITILRQPDSNPTSDIMQQMMITVTTLRQSKHFVFMMPISYYFLSIMRKCSCKFN